MERHTLAGQSALVTGAAGGIGAAVARLFAAEGAAVALVDREAAALEALKGELEATGAAVRAVPADLTQAPSVARAAEAVVEAFGALTLLVNAHGVLRRGRVDEMDEADWDAVMGVNVKGVLLACKYAVPALRAAGGGAVVNLASVSAFVGSDDSSAYHASKGAVLSLSYRLAQELAPSGIRVNALCPGWVDAGFTHQVLREAPDPGALQAAARERHALGRMATPEEVAQAALFLASPAASFVTGTALFVDGGFMVKR